MSKKEIFTSLIIVILFISGCATISPPIAFRPEGVYHIVGSGQTLYRIAKTYNVDIQEIIRINHIPDPHRLGVGQELFIPRAGTLLPVEPYRPLAPETIEKIVGPKYRSSKWRYITIHHSATLEGNAETFDRNHRRRRMGGLFYHFVLGNGAGSGDGELEVGWRWMRQILAERPYDIQICLVGDFNRQEVSEAQFRSLAELIRVLRRHYNISLKNIRRHKDIRGKPTECPGDNFPFYRLLAELRRSRP